MRPTTRTLLTTTAALTLVIPLAACGGADDDAQAPPAPPAPPATTGDVPGATDDAPDDAPGAADDPLSTPGAADDATAGSGATDDSTSAPGGGSGDVDRNSAVLDAVALAEAEAGGTAFEVDSEDNGDGGWEVSVAVGEDDVEVAVSLDGSEVLGSRDDGSLSSNERAALDMATITITDAITTALDEVGGTIDDVDFHGDDGDDESPAWEVSIDDTADDDVEVYVDATSGDVLEVDR